MDWTENFFGKYYLTIHKPLLTKQITLQEINFIIDILDLDENNFILDIPCGFGRHSIPLAEKGFNVIGIDNNDEFLSLANRIKNTRNLKNINFIKEDMQNLDYKNKFDAIINLFTSFGYYDDEVNFDILKRMSKSLKKGGKLLIEFLNREWTIINTRINNQVWVVYPNNIVFLANNNFDVFTGRWISEQKVVDNGEIFNQSENIRLYSYVEMNKMLNELGLEIITSYGDYDKSPYTSDSTKMIILAEKKI